MGREQTIDRLWESSNHGTRREDVVAAFEAGVAAERERCTKLAAWLKWCLDNCDDSPEWNFGKDATEHMRALLAGMPAPMPGA